MAAIKLASFGGVSPKTPARYLPDNMAQVAINCPAFSGSLVPLRAEGESLLTLPKTQPPKTIYRFGQDAPSDTQYWFHWPFDVDVCRSQVSGDASEWTFYTGDGAPKATYNALALAGSTYPFASRPLGLPAPSSALIATVLEQPASAHPAEIVLSKAQLASIQAASGIQYSTTDTDSYATASLANNDKATVAAALDAVEGLTATVEGDGVLVKTDATGDGAKLYLKFVTGQVADTSGAFAYSGYDSGAKTGKANTEAFLVIPDSEIGSIAAGDMIFLSETTNGTTTTLIDNVEATSAFASAAAFATWLNARQTGLTVAAYGSCVVITPDTKATGAGGKIVYQRKITEAKATLIKPFWQYYVFSLFAQNLTTSATLPSGGSGLKIVTTIEATGAEAAAPAAVLVTQAELAGLDAGYASVTVNGVESVTWVAEGAQISGLTGWSGYGLQIQTFGAVTPFAVVGTSAVGTLATLRIRAGAYPQIDQFAYLKAEGYVDKEAVPETRVYTYTWVNKEAGWEFESPPSGPSNSLEVLPGGTVSLSGFASAPGGDYLATHKRIYRAASGVYLYVDEIPSSQTAYTDEKKAEDLGEELPVMAWVQPPDALRGLINLPNGMMAGFVGRDVYFCDPYHPQAWPVEYMQSVDYPVVGLGRMDTTLAVLTTGVPYFIQGGHPGSMTVVKSDIEQACASKRSIVSFNGAVVYASPDGLVMLTPGGSKLITQAMFTRDQWQSLSPASMHAYQHNNRYVCFYDAAGTRGGFIFDFISGVFIMHDRWAECGFADMQTDKLYLGGSDRSLKVWDAGDALSYTWRSKKFTAPQVTSFACAQLEAEAYPMTCRVYVDGALLRTQVVENRLPFRLPVKAGRDWEVQLEGVQEVFSFAMAQSMQELAGV